MLHRQTKTVTFHADLITTREHNHPITGRIALIGCNQHYPCNSGIETDTCSTVKSPPLFTCISFALAIILKCRWTPYVK